MTSTWSSSAPRPRSAPHQIDEAKGGKLKLIIRGGVGVDNIDVDYAKASRHRREEHPARFLRVRRRAGDGAYVLLRPLHLPSPATPCATAKWEKKAYGKGIELCGKTLGVVGFGRIGQTLGVMAKAIGMNVIAFDIFHIPGIEEQLGIPYVEMDELLAKSDFISVHAPAVDGGALINAERIAKMKDGVVIINTSRGTNVDEAALLAASGERQGPRRRSGRVRRRARHQQGALQPSRWSPARRTSAPPPSRPRSASARRSWTSSPRCKLLSPIAAKGSPQGLPFCHTRAAPFIDCTNNIL